MDSQYVLEMNHIEKEFFGNKVLKDVSIRVKPGEILSLVGENGAGKSTIMNILFGMPAIHQTGGFGGKVLIEGEEVNIHSPQEAMAAGIGMVHQEFMLIDGFEVAENIKLNREVTKKNPVSRVLGRSMEIVDRKQMRTDARKVMDDLGITLSETARVGGLPVGYKQFVEIARELDKSNIKLIVLDEPTAVLTESEAEQFLGCVRKVAERGVAFIFISHKLDEVMNNANRVNILRDGEMVGDFPIEELTAIKISQLMVGREVEILNRQAEEEQAADVALELRKFSVKMPGEQVRQIDLEIRRGEIFGIGGLAGHGKISISNGIMGVYPSLGEVFLHGEKINPAHTEANMKKGLAFVSEDRRGVGLMLDDSIELNIAFSAMRIRDQFLKKVAGLRFYDKKGAVGYAEQKIDELNIRCTGPAQPVKNLSGGNQQKVCIARALALEPDILLVSEPTRGIDIGAKKLILDYLLKLNKEQNVTIIITSSELAELRSVCNRIAIITEGKVAGILGAQAPDYQYGLLMSGITDMGGEAV